MDRRKILLLDSAWNPGIVGPTAWYYAASQYVSLNGTGVVVWADRTAQGNDVIQPSVPSQPQWEAAGGWNSRSPSIRSTGRVLQTASSLSPIVADFSGTNRPFTVLCTCQVISYTGTEVICKWDDPVAPAEQECSVTSSQFMNIERVDNASSTKSGTSTTPPLGLGHVRLAYTFNGILANTYVNNIRAIGPVQLDTGAATFARFNIGPGRDIRYTELVVYPRAFAAAEVAAYYSYSLNEWGA